MKKLTWLLFLFIYVGANAQLNVTFKPFQFAFVTDTHIGSPNGSAEEDLRRTVRDINAHKDEIAFVLLTGDITELGTNEEIKFAKSILDSLQVKWYIIPGNHDTGWSESGGDTFNKVFGDDKFSFTYNGVRFLGCASGPYVRMSDGHVPRSAVNWLDAEIKKLGKEQPLIMVNHYPLDNSLDNWYEVTDRIRKANTWVAICGHGHSNRKMNFEGVNGVMGRSNLRAKANIGGYNWVNVNADTIYFSERRPEVKTLNAWAKVAVPTSLNPDTISYARPSYAINEQYKQVTEKWTISDKANIISTPAVAEGKVVVGNQNGTIGCYNLLTGKSLWKYQTAGSIFSTPAIAKSKVVVGSGDGSVYCLDLKTGKLNWQYKTDASVLGCPLISGDTIFIGGSDHSFLALTLLAGKQIWKYSGLEGPVVSLPLQYQGKIIFGAWDRNLYALDQTTGVLAWKWNNGSPIRNYSPASCIPVANDGVVYIMAPDRFVTAIDASNGQTLWRNNDGGVRESIGIAASGQFIYGKSMQDTIVAYHTSREKQSAAWKMHVGFGYEHVPSMLIERNGQLYFGTRNGVVYCIDPIAQKNVWAHKIDNSMVNTVKLVDDHSMLVTTMDGKLSLLNY